MPETPTKILEQSEIRDLLQGAKQCADAMLTECKFVPATALDGLAANLATLFDWSRLQDTDGIGFFFITNGAVYMDNIAPTVCCTVPDAVRCARHELKQLKPRDFSNFPFVRSDDNLADFFTKPLKPQRFFELRDKIMNVKEPSSPSGGKRSSFAET